MSKLLVVNDSDIDRHLVMGLLRGETTWEIETAADGVEALARLNKSPVNLVLTDMQMPNMDGLELVKQIRIQHPEVPVILMTAHGSESLAIEALEQGAASYVPKSRLSDVLEETIWHVLSLASSDQNYERLVACQTRAEFTFILQNDDVLIDPLVDLIGQFAHTLKLCDSNGRLRIGVALQQAIVNAQYHGNLELTSEQLEGVRESLVATPQNDILQQRRQQPPYRDRKVVVNARITREKVEVKIADEGPGFDISPHKHRTTEPPNTSTAAADCG